MSRFEERLRFPAADIAPHVLSGAFSFHIKLIRYISISMLLELLPFAGGGDRYDAIYKPYGRL